jgi:bacillithiol system protein YtxJ
MSSQLWNNIKSVDDIAEAVMQSNAGDVLIYKHSSRCGVCWAAKRRLETVDTDQLPIYMVDVIADRALSNMIADRFDVTHESPQAILLRNGEAVIVKSHSSIRPEVFLSP